MRCNGASARVGKKALVLFSASVVTLPLPPLMGLHHQLKAEASSCHTFTFSNAPMIIMHLVSRGGHRNENAGQIGPDHSKSHISSALHAPIQPKDSPPLGPRLLRRDVALWGRILSFPTP